MPGIETDPLARRARVDRARLRLLERSPTSTLKDLLTATLDLAEELTGSRIGFFHFVEEDEGTLWLQAWSTNTLARMCTAEGGGSHYPIERAGIWADCVRTGKPVIHDDYASAPGRKGMPPGHAPVVRELTVPVVRNGRVCAALGVGNKPSGYDEADVADVSILADLAWDIAARKRAEEALAASEARNRALLDSMRDGLVVVGLDGAIRDFNDEYRKMLGYPADELRTRTHLDLTPGRWHAAEAKIIAEQVLSRGFSDVYEKEYRRKDGSILPVELRTVLMREGGQPAAMLAIVRDVTERKQAQLTSQQLNDQIQRERDLLSALLESISDEVWFADQEGRFVLANPAALAEFGMRGLDGVPVEELARSLEVLRSDGSPRPVDEAPPLRALRGVAVVDEEEQVRTPSAGELRTRRVSASPVRNHAGAVIGSVSVVRDVTERRRAQEALRASEQRYRDIVELSPDAILVNRANRVVFVNQAALTLFGASHAEELLGRSPFELFDPGSHALVRERIAKLLEGGKAPPARERVLRLDGATREVEVAAASFADAEGIAIQVVLHDVTEQIEREAALRASEEHFRQLVQHLPVPIAFNDPEGRVLTLNPRFTQVLGYTPEDIPTLSDWFPRAYPEPAYREEVLASWNAALRRAAEAGGEISPAEYRVTTKGGEVRIMLISGVPVGQNLLVTLFDVTEARALQAQLALSSRLAAMGTLVAGVAHEVNNPLAAELADQGIALELVREVRDRLHGGAAIDRPAEVRLLDDAMEALAEAQEGGQRIARIVKNLSAFGRPDPRRSPVRLAGVVAGALRWLPAAVAQAATVQVEDGGAPEVVASAGQLEQVVVNLVTNAAKAMPPGRRGLIRIRMGPGAPGTSRLEVSDDGKGIAPAMLERIFEPFFTTRPAGPGRGMGLGLAICHALVTAHGGTLSVTSTPGKGSTFRMELPAAPPEGSREG